jgi:hypothetical protein
MPGQQQQQPNNSPMLIAMRPAFTIATFFADVATASIRPFTRYREGTRGMGTAGFWAMVSIPVYAGLAEAPDMLAYWHLWLAMAIYRRITADPAQDTRFQGFAWMFTWCTNSELSAKLMEAAAMPVIGGIVSSALSEDIGHFITVVGTFSFAYRYVLDAMTEARRRELAQNAIREMEAMQKHFHR